MTPYIVVYTLEKGRQALTWSEWINENEALHNIDGPAVIFRGTEEWFIEDECYTEERFNKTIQEVKDMSEVLRLIDPRKWVREFK